VLVLVQLGPVGRVTPGNVVATMGVGLSAVLVVDRIRRYPIRTETTRLEENSRVAFSFVVVYSTTRSEKVSIPRLWITVANATLARCQHRPAAAAGFGALCSVAVESSVICGPSLSDNSCTSHDDMHAGELETSILLVTHPGRVRVLPGIQNDHDGGTFGEDERP
jgi:hypothetical protein